MCQLTGKKINRFTHIHQSTDDLVKKTKMGRLLGAHTGCCFQRCVGMDCNKVVVIHNRKNPYPVSCHCIVWRTYEIHELEQNPSIEKILYDQYSSPISL